MREPCKTCFYKDASGMVDPCFPCLQKRTFITGERKRLFSEWTDGKLSQKQIDDWDDWVEKQMMEEFSNDPEIQRLIEEISKAC